MSMNKHEWCEGRGRVANVGTAMDALVRLLSISEEDATALLGQNGGAEPKNGVAEALKCLSGVRPYLNAGSLWLLAFGEFRRLFPREPWGQLWSDKKVAEVLECNDTARLMSVRADRAECRAFIDTCRSLFRHDKEKNWCILRTVQLNVGSIGFVVEIEYGRIADSIRDVVKDISRGSPDARHLTALRPGYLKFADVGRGRRFWLSGTGARLCLRGGRWFKQWNLLELGWVDKRETDSVDYR
jgi:hypothetical protein